MEEHDILKNAIKLYQAGKDNYSKDEILAKKCLALSLDKLNKLKETHKSSKYNQLIQTTEAECHKLLNSSEESIFKLITMNNIESIRKASYINFREINNSGNTVLHHAIDIGDTGILKELFKKGGMIDSVNGNGNTLLEYACLKKDPNIISFLILHGASMEKHLFFRKGNNKYYLNKSDIDMAILLKLVVKNIKNINCEIDENNKFKFLEKFFNPTDLIGLDKFTVKDLIIGLHNMFNDKESYETYKQIIIEELDTYEKNKTINTCSHNKIDIVLSNIVPFINYPFNLSSIFLIKNELKYTINNMLKQNEKEFKNILLSKIFETYVHTKLFHEDYIGIILYNILSKIKI
jgi:hypothetical protein